MNNFLEQIDITSEDIEDKLSTVEYKRTGRRMDKIENGNFPMFMFAMLDLISEHGKIPDQNEFYTYYMDKNKYDQRLLFENEKESKAFEARLKERAYPSLVREVHFALYLKENTGYEVIYNRYVDVKEGVDLILKDGEDEFHLKLFLASARSLKRKAVKDKIHEHKEGIFYIDVPLCFWYKDSIGLGDGFYLYDSMDLHYVEKEMEKCRKLVV